MNQVQALLKKHGYMLTLTYNKNTKKIKLNIPSRIQPPITDAYSIEYSFVDNMVYCIIDNKTTEIECPTYACRTLIFVDIKKICEYLGFDTTLLEFYDEVDNIKVSESEFFYLMWPADMGYTEKIRQSEEQLITVVAKALNAIIPFHESFTFEAQQMGVGLGYGLIRAFNFGENKE